MTTTGSSPPRPIEPPLSAHSSLVLHRAGQGLEALAQVGDQPGIADERRIVVRELDREERWQPIRRRHIPARRPGVELALLLLLQEPGKKESCRVRMRRI